MKIIHLCLSSFYIEDFGYQENIIPKYHRKFGHEVYILASPFSYSKKNGHVEYLSPTKYINKDGIKVIRLQNKYKLPITLNNKLKIYKDTLKYLKEINPEIIFVHGIQFYDLLTVAKYKREINPNCVIYADNHAANINSATNFFSKWILHKLFYKSIIKFSLNEIRIIFNIAPGCETFAKEMYDIPQKKMDLLYLGADTDLINLRDKENIKSVIRKELRLSNDDIVIITGGKLEYNKNIHLLIDALNLLNNSKVKLIIFGSIPESNKINLENKIKINSNIRWVGWLEGKEVYDHLISSDIAIFPGSKSALWEQAICTGLPLICKKWSGMEYVDVGGNCIFLENDSVQEILLALKKIVENDSLRYEMSAIALEKGFKRFSYEEISKKAIELKN